MTNKAPILSDRMERTTVYFSPDVKSWLRTEATAQRRSISSLLECLAVDYRQAQEKQAATTV